MKLRLIFTILSVFFALSLVSASEYRSHEKVKFPETPAGIRAKEVMDLINSGKPDEIEKFVNGNFAVAFRNAFPLDQHVGIIVRTHDLNKKLELNKIETSSEYRISCLLLSPSTSQLLSLDLQTEETAPNRITRMGFRPGGVYESSSAKKRSPQETTETGKSSKNKSRAPKSISQKELTKILDEFIDQLVEKDEFSGTVLVAKKGKPIYSKAVGYAHQGFKVPNKPDTKFCLASMNKMFTGTAIMQLVQQGKLNLDDKVGKHLPNYPNEDIRDKVTIHHLLTHTSGMGSYWREFFESPKKSEINTVSDYDNLANGNPLLFEPGERFEYSNCGPLVLGLIIEEIAGLSYDEYIRRFITGPAEMGNTDCYNISESIDNLAIGYTNGRSVGRSFNPRRNNLFMNPVKGGPAGGGYSTVEDLLKFDLALRNNILLNKENFDIMTTGKVNRNETNKYAYLFTEKFVNGERIVGHNGGTAGLNSHLAMYMNSGYTVAIMSNYDPPAAEKLAQKIENVLSYQ
ncbi:MAG: beta-lactamase family protein [Bacteroidetes bacterium]|jgi:CubicO group peptidase (beta-lactamase class C family)|nr:beta-lactamase family protein [Bacteroidota bacterium]MBT3750123.1 beta-lactamase family protein [Bacteroidota bacterium]MBT4401783.1 beta-lactamase family protein [Bacteroidota bacterium]MBT4412153.1 beta-lactamase family protein [Bacteroidota bacterium]MBT7095561.1 beta-lactamase family protein [Bacteroidota bacterium]